MTLAEIRSAVRALIKEQSTEVGALFPGDNTLLDFYINSATELVVMDLVPFMQETFITSEYIGVTATVSTYTMTGTPLRFWAMMRNVNSEVPKIIRQYPIVDVPNKMLVGETAEDPLGWYMSGEKTINFFPIPSTTIANYAKLWYVPTEAATMVAGGPAIIPAPAHRLIPLRAASLISMMNDETADRYGKLYSEFLRAVQMTYAARIQQQPRFLGPSFKNRINANSTLDKAFYDLGSPFEE